MDRQVDCLAHGFLSTTVVGIHSAISFGVRALGHGFCL